MSLLHRDVPRDALAELSYFRMEFYACLTGRSDALFELGDALLCEDGPVKTLVELSLAPEHRCGHGALYGGLNRGRLDVARLRRALVGLPLPRTAEGRLVLVVVDAGYDVTRLVFLLADLPVELLGRMRSDRVLYFPPPPQPAGKRGRKPKRGAEFKFEDPDTQPAPTITTVTPTTPKDRCRSSKARSSVFRSTTYAATATPGRSGCGGQSQAPVPGMGTGSGKHSCADSILNTPSG